MKSLKRIILVIAAVLSLALALSVYFLYSGVDNLVMQRTALAQAETVARLTTSNMNQLMMQGWKHDQVSTFTKSATDTLTHGHIDIDFHRGDLVAILFGQAKQKELDKEQAEAMNTGQPRSMATQDGGRYIYPLVAQGVCLKCHTNAHEGDVLGVVTVASSFDKSVGDARMLVMVVLLFFAPMPLVAAWLLVIYLDSRLERFSGQLDQALDRADQAGGRPDLSGVRPAFSELDDLLVRFKRLIAGPGKQP
jgi:hypothetical protein